MRQTRGLGNTQASRTYREVLLAALAVMMLLVVLGPAMTSFSNMPMSGEGNPFRQAAYIMAAAVVLVSLRPLAEPSRLIAVPPPVAIALAMCWISILWAVDPDIAMRRLILTTVVTWMICAAVAELGYGTTTKMLRIFLFLVLIANFATVYGWPELGIHQVNDRGDYQLLGNWRGFLMHKNTAGALCGVTVLFFVFDSKAIPPSIRWTIVAATAFFLYNCRSRTSLGMAVAAVIAGYIYLRVGRRYRAAMVGATFIASLIVVGILNIYRGPLTAVVSDVKTLTGRPYIWSAVLHYAQDNLWLGAGFGSFWNIGPRSPIYQYAKGWITEITSAHNGFLDLLVQLGLPGTILVVAMLVIWPLGRLLSSRIVAPEQGALLTALLVFSVGHNLTESSFLDRDNVMSVFLIFTISLIWAVRMPRSSDPSELWSTMALRSARPST